MPERRFEVWGDPIAHSLSPVLHRAAYAQLGWDWEYERRRVDEAGFATALTGRDVDLGGLSLTYPLKNAAWAASEVRDARAELTGAVNTLVFGMGAVVGFNTDVGGIVADLREHGLDGVSRARIIGSGATATSALVALREHGVDHVEVVSRREPVTLLDLGIRIGVPVGHRGLGADGYDPVDLTVATLPGGIALPDETAAALAAAGGTLYDVVYGHWPTTLASAWLARGAVAIPGIGMLLHQAVLQIRAFATGETATPLEDEPAVVASMRRALMKD